MKDKKEFVVRSKPAEENEKEPQFVPQVTFSNQPPYPHSPSVGGMTPRGPYSIPNPPIYNAPPPYPPQQINPQVNPQNAAGQRYDPAYDAHYMELERRINDKKRELFSGIFNNENYSFEVRRKIFAHAVLNVIKALDPHKRYFRKFTVTNEGTLVCEGKNGFKFNISLDGGVVVMTADQDKFFEIKHKPEDLLNPNGNAIMVLFAWADWEV